jgi:hypothetical protein
MLLSSFIQPPNACLTMANCNVQLLMENVSLSVMDIIGYRRSVSRLAFVSS